MKPNLFSPRYLFETARWTSILPVAALTVGMSIASSEAQTPGAIDQVDTAQQRRALDQSADVRYQSGDSLPDLYPGETDDVGPQSVLSVKRRRTLFEGVADSQYYYTDNVFLDHSSRIASGVLVSTAQLALAPTPYQLGGGEAAPRIGFREQWFNFFEYTGHGPSLNTYDFNAQTAFLGEEWTFNNTWRFGVGFDYTRLLTGHDYRQFYAEYVPHWDVTHLTPIGRKEVLSIGYQGYYHFSDAFQFQILPENSFFNRLDQMLVANFSWALSDNLIIQPYDTFRYTHFTSTVHRDDYLNSVGISAYYFFNNYLSARVFTSFDRRFSNVTQADYRMVNAGAGVNFTLRL